LGFFFLFTIQLCTCFLQILGSNARHGCHTVTWLRLDEMYSLCGAACLFYMLILDPDGNTI
jgi:hypothetical protein